MAAGSDIGGGRWCGPGFGVLAGSYLLWAAGPGVAVRLVMLIGGGAGRAAGKQRHRGGVQAGAAAEGGAFVLGEHRDAGLQQRIDQRLEPVPGCGGLIGVIGLVRALSSSSVRRRFFGSGDGSMTDKIAWKQYRTRR
jgi:hypothetical protein